MTPRRAPPLARWGAAVSPRACAPFPAHLDLVVFLLRGVGRHDLAVAGYLHDVLEDTRVTSAELAAHFPAAAAVVEACTGRGANRRERQADIARKIAHNPDAQTVKVADRLANMLSARANGNERLSQMYAREFDHFYFATPAADVRLRAMLAVLHS